MRGRVPAHWTAKNRGVERQHTIAVGVGQTSGVLGEPRGDHNLHGKVGRGLAQPAPEHLTDGVLTLHVSAKRTIVDQILLAHPDHLWGVELVGLVQLGCVRFTVSVLCWL